MDLTLALFPPPHEVAEWRPMCFCANGRRNVVCANCVAFGDRLPPPFVWIAQFANSKVHLGTFSAIREQLPNDLADIVFGFLHAMCRHERQFLLHMQLRQHCYLYLL